MRLKERIAKVLYIEFGQRVTNWQDLPWKERQSFLGVADDILEQLLNPETDMVDAVWQQTSDSCSWENAEKAFIAGIKIAQDTQ